MATKRRTLPLITERMLHEVRSVRQVEVSDVEIHARTQGTTCRKGCHTCCSYPVWISLWEGLLLYQGLETQGVLTGTLRSALREHARQTWLLQPHVWYLAAIPCPLLTPTGLCRAVRPSQDMRPFLCRTTWSLRDPEECHPTRHGVSGLLPRGAAVERFGAVERKATKAHRQSGHAVWPISVAVLVAERIMSGELDPTVTVNQLWVMAETGLLFNEGPST